MMPLTKLCVYYWPFFPLFIPLKKPASGNTDAAGPLAVDTKIAFISHLPDPGKKKSLHINQEAPKVWAFDQNASNNEKT